MLCGPGARLVQQTGAGELVMSPKVTAGLLIGAAIIVIGPRIMQTVGEMKARAQMLSLMQQQAQQQAAAMQRAQQATAAQNGSGPPPQPSGEQHDDLPLGAHYGDPRSELIFSGVG